MYFQMLAIWIVHSIRLFPNTLQSKGLLCAIGPRQCSKSRAKRVLIGLPCSPMKGGGGSPFTTVWKKLCFSGWFICLKKAVFSENPAEIHPNIPEKVGPNPLRLCHWWKRMQWQDPTYPGNARPKGLGNECPGPLWAHFGGSWGGVFRP